MTVKWNLTKSVERSKKADVLVMSVTKSGRTWLRVLLNKYLSLHYQVPFGVDDLSRQNPDVPHVFFTHELWEHLSKTGLFQRLRGKHLVPDDILFEKKVILLYRDPRDVVVSLYFQETKRAKKRVDTDIHTFIRHPRFGIARIVHVLNIWRERLRDHPECAWLCYEKMRRDTIPEMLSILTFLGVDPVNDEMVKDTVEFAAFENMKKMEASGAFESGMLRPGDQADPQSFKVREGKVGGYRRHFSDEDIEYLDRIVATLDPFYGYSTKAGL